MRSFIAAAGLVLLIGCGNITQEAYEADRLADDILIEMERQNMLKDNSDTFNMQIWMSNEIFLRCRNIDTSGM
jgi:hypothetical protein